MKTEHARAAARWLLIPSLAGLATLVQAQDGLLKDALSAAPPMLAEQATAMDWEGNVLQQGSNGYTCFPTPPNQTGPAPMCLDAQWQAWAEAWQSKKPFSTNMLGIAYMLAGDGGASNTDPYAEKATDDNEWVQEGPHLMIIGPAALLEAYPSDPDNGGAYLMWRGTPYQHLMVPVGPRQ